MIGILLKDASYEQDIRGSLAHAAMLARQGIISEADGAAMEAGLKGILEGRRGERRL